MSDIYSDSKEICNRCYAQDKWSRKYQILNQKYKNHNKLLNEAYDLFRRIERLQVDQTLTSGDRKNIQELRDRISINVEKDLL